MDTKNIFPEELINTWDAKEKQQSGIYVSDETTLKSNVVVASDWLHLCQHELELKLYFNIQPNNGFFFINTAALNTHLQRSSSVPLQ